MKRHLIIAFCLTIIAGSAVAEDYKYVSDSFAITVRTGKDTTHKIIRSIKTGDKVQVLEEDPDGYSRIKLDDNSDGWVLSRYLIDTPTARQQLGAANKKVADLEKQLTSLKSELSNVSGNYKSLNKSSTGLQNENEKLSRELKHIKSIAANQLALNDENKELKQKLLAVKREIQEIQQENISLKDSSGRTWFLIGAGVVIAGIILGLILPNLRFRRRQSWSSL